MTCSRKKKVQFVEDLPPDEWCKRISRWRGVRRLSGREGITAAGMRHLSKLKQLESLDLTRTWINDDAILGLSELPSLIDLSLSETKVTAKGLSVLRRFKKLRSLALEGTKIDDSALEAVSKLGVKL